MLLENEIKKLISELGKTAVAQIDLGGVATTVKIFDEGGKIFLSTPVYFGGNYIPASVRNCIKQRAPFDRLSIQTNLQLDEDNFVIHLNHISHVENITNKKFIDLLEDFGWLAERWREYLDEHDKNDLVHVPR